MSGYGIDSKLNVIDTVVETMSKYWNCDLDRSDKMECPICKNKLGFNCGTCIECGYNYLNGKFEHIRVYVDDLKNIVPLDILEELIEEHKKFKKR